MILTTPEINVAKNYSLRRSLTFCHSMCARDACLVRIFHAILFLSSQVRNPCFVSASKRLVLTSLFSDDFRNFPLIDTSIHQATLFDSDNPLWALCLYTCPFSMLSNEQIEHRFLVLTFNMPTMFTVHESVRIITRSPSTRKAYNTTSNPSPYPNIFRCLRCYPIFFELSPLTSTPPDPTLAQSNLNGKTPTISCRF